MERWLEVFEFPGYSVSSWGRVKNDETGRVLTMFRNQGGYASVSMSRDRIQYKRGIARLVANRFLPKSTLDEFVTPIHLNGDRTNNAAHNLAWRPKWFADYYTRQWNSHGTRIDQPILDAATGEVYENSTDAARKHGLLERDIVESISDGVKVFPTLQKFEIAS